MATKPHGNIQFEQKGIGNVLAHNFLKVPPNQREYSWEDGHVRDLLQDFARAIDAGPTTYFLGTLVFTASEDGIPEVADGQQRLATTTMILAAIRDYFHHAKDGSRVTGLEKYLRDIDMTTAMSVPKLKLNIEDSEFFRRLVVLSPDDPDRKTVTPTKESHERIAKAATVIRQYFSDVLKTRAAKDHAEILVRWVDFIRDLAQVIQLLVPDHMNAFTMFETLNDRGLKASQADLLKNYLFQLAEADRMQEAHHLWARMIAILESIGYEEVVMDYLRHMTICLNGPTKEKDVFSVIRLAVTSKGRSMDFLAQLADGAKTYAALFNPEQPLWNKFGATTRGHVRTMLQLRVGQIRPLMFAVLRSFPDEEVKKAMKLFVVWSVRFLIVGGRGGVLDEAYGQRAQEVTNGKIGDAHALAASMDDVVPNDTTFETVFRDARVSQTFLARYYLRALEQQAKDQPEPEWIPNDAEAINLEHILPDTPGEGWDIDEETAAAYSKRLGNMVLLSAKKNVEIGNKPFAEKRTVYAESGYILTVEASKPKEWTIPEIVARQKRLAELAVQAWPLAVSKPTKGGKLPKKGATK